MTRTEAMQRVRDMLDAWNARDLERFASFFTVDAEWHDLGMPNPPAIGRAAIHAFAKSALLAFPDFTYTMRGPICVSEDGGSCVLPWTIVATNTGMLNPPGFAPTGRRAQFDGLDYFIFRDDLVARLESRFDPLAALEQLFDVQLRPPAGSWRERMMVAAQRVRARSLRRRERRAR